MPKYLNEQKHSTDRLYVAIYIDDTVYLYAATDAAADQKAREYFKPKTRKMSLFYVTRA